MFLIIEHNLCHCREKLGLILYYQILPYAYEVKMWFSSLIMWLWGDIAQQNYLAVLLTLFE